MPNLMHSLVGWIFIDLPKTPIISPTTGFCNNSASLNKPKQIQELTNTSMHIFSTFFLQTLDFKKKIYF